MIQSSPYYSIAENILEEPEIGFIFPAVNIYMNELSDKQEEYNLNDHDIVEFYERFMQKANNFYFEYLHESDTFEKNDLQSQIEIIYNYIQQRELPSWVYDETEFEDSLKDDDSLGDKEPYDVSKIDIINDKFQVAYLYDRYKEKELELSPDYQRKFVWTLKQKSRLIESILIRIPLPIFYIDSRNEDKWVVIDGLQRLTSIFNFIDNDFKLNNLEYLKDLDGSRFKQLERKFQRRINEFQLLCNLVRPNTPPDIAFNIFQRINTLGTKLEIQEIRNAMYLGQSTRFLEKLSVSEEFIKIASEKRMKSYKKHMEDHAIILRYLAFKITNYTEYDNNDMNAFLSKAMGLMNSMDDIKIRSLENTFKECMVKANILFDKDPFMKPANKTPNPNWISKVLFESIGYALDQYKLEEIENNKTILLEKIYDIYENKEFKLKTSVATNNPPHVKYRFEKILEIFNEAIGH